MSEPRCLCKKSRSKRYEACSDAAYRRKTAICCSVRSISRPKGGPGCGRAQRSGSRPKPNRSPAKRVRFGKEEQRNERALTFEKSRSKRYEACSDAAYRRKTAICCSVRSISRPKGGPGCGRAQRSGSRPKPNRSPAKRVRFGKEEQRNERALTFEKSRSKRYEACSDVELMVGIEPTTFSLRVRCSAIEPHQHIHNNRYFSTAPGFRQERKEKYLGPAKHPTAFAVGCFAVTGPA